MFDIDPERATGAWQNRVRFGPSGTFAYRPGEILVGVEVADLAHEKLASWIAETDEGVELERDEEPVAGAFVRFTGSFEVHGAVELLHAAGILSQVNHVLFATSCCPPHPAHPCADDFYANPFYANPFYANPFYANPFYANPFYANPFYANPFYANAGGGCGCGCGCGGATANPFYANPFYANPFYANASPSPFRDQSAQLAGCRNSSARPAEPPAIAARPPVPNVRVAILDTGWADAAFAPQGLPGISVDPSGFDQPDEDKNGFLDPAAGHGTFIAGIIEQITPGCDMEVFDVLGTYGDGDEVTIAKVLHGLSQLPDDQRPDLVNLSFGGYSPLGMGALAKAISDLHDAGSVVVASAGNDASCLPMFPAALPDVVAVAALDENDNAATFTNYGPWVRACARGTDIVSLFFDNFNGAGPAENNYDPDKFEGWALWSGTSFAAPVVAAALAREVGQGETPHAAVANLIDDENLDRKPMLGTVVKPA